jgi:GMP synthase-like glutamine amidotransferase
MMDGEASKRQAMPHLTRREMLRLALAGGAASLLAGCGMAAPAPSPTPLPTQPPPTPEPTSAPATPTKRPPTPTPIWEDVFKYGMGAGLDDGHVKLNQSTEPLVVFLDTIHPNYFPSKLPYVEKVKQRSEELSGLPCLVVHLSQLPKADMRRANIKAIIIDNPVETISARLTNLLYAFIRETPIPMIGFCGGHSTMYTAYGGVGAYMRPLRPGEIDLSPSYHGGYYKEWAFMPVRIIKQDPLFDGLPDPFIMQEFHAFEAKQLPDFLDVLASTDECRVQVIKHKEKLHYGTQFHPEDYDVQHPDGKTLWRNFFKLALKG